MLEKGKPGMGAPGTYAFELKQTCDGYVINQRMRLEVEGAKGSVVSEQTSTDDREPRRPEAALRASQRGQRQADQPAARRCDPRRRRPRPVAVQRAGRPVGRAAQGHAVPQCADARHHPARQGGGRRLRHAVLLRREGEAAAVGERGDRPGAQAARRFQASRGRRVAGRESRRASITAAPSSRPSPRARPARRRTR